MPARSRTSFQKRQKELLRAEKQRDKAARRLARKLAPKETGDPDMPPEESAETEDQAEAGAEANGAEAQDHDQAEPHEPGEHAV